MSQDIKESPKQASLHATSKPARASTIRGADPNAKSRVLDPGTAASDSHNPPPGPDAYKTAGNFDPALYASKERPVTVFLSQAQYDAVKAYADAEKVGVEELFLHFAEDLVAAMKLQTLGNSPTDEPPAP
jgi:hypothetical protein